jgi:hypothetical protein
MYLLDFCYVTLLAGFTAISCDACKFSDNNKMILITLQIKIVQLWCTSAGIVAIFSSLFYKPEFCS